MADRHARADQSHPLRGNRVRLFTARHRRLLALGRFSLFTAPLLAVLWVGLMVLVARGEALPGVRVGAVPIDGLDAAQAHAAVERHFGEVLEEPIELVVDGRTWTPVPGELGFSIDAGPAVDRALAYGRDHQVLDGVLRAAHLPSEPVTVPVSVGFDAGAFDAYLDRVERELGGAPVDAAVVLEDGHARVLPARPGAGIDRDAVRHTIAERLMASGPVTVDTDRIEQAPEIRTQEAERAGDAVEAVVADPLVLVAGDARWALEPSRMLAMLEVVPDPGTPGVLLIRASVDDVRVVVDEIAGELDQEPSDAWIDDLGTHSWLVPSKSGRTVDREGLVRAVQQVLASGEREVTVPFIDEVEPDVTTEDVMRELGITEVVAAGDSVYAGSGSGRAHNVELAAHMIDGTLVPPGGVFSFNDAVGSLFTGEYLDAGSYIDGPNGMSIAGGVCQVSTTVYRAALTGGFPILEWYPHSYRSPYYELGGWQPGYDASITQYAPDPSQSADFQFSNPTDSWLLIRSTVSPDGELTVEIHGAPTGYEVSFDEPVIETVEWATDEVTVSVDEELPPGTILPDQPKMDGLQVTVVRYVHDAEGNEVSVDTFVSTYGSYGAIRRVSPDMESAAYGE